MLAKVSSTLGVNLGLDYPPDWFLANIGGVTMFETILKLSWQEEFKTARAQQPFLLAVLLAYLVAGSNHVSTRYLAVT